MMSDQKVLCDLPQKTLRNPPPEVLRNPPQKAPVRSPARKTDAADPMLPAHRISH